MPFKPFDILTLLPTQSTPHHIAQMSLLLSIQEEQENVPERGFPVFVRRTDRAGAKGTGDAGERAYGFGVAVGG
jgi:hypothetical protein